MDVPTFLRAADVAAALDVSKRTVWRMISDGRLGAVRAGGLVRVPTAELRRLERMAAG